jgi:hypothetical protein
MSTELDAIVINNSQLFRVSVYDIDGVTLLTPSACVCDVWNKDSGVQVITAQAGTVGAGYAQYNWAGNATAGRYEAILTVTVSAGVVKSEHFFITLLAKPPVFAPTSTLARLILALTEEVPAMNSVPTANQYEQAIREAVLDFSRRCGLVKIGSLAIISGTATYSLATDFLKMIALDALTGIDGVIVADKLIPVSKDFEEEYTIVNKQITFYPTPQYTMTRYYRYKMQWVATAGDYTTLGEDEQQIVLLLAKSKCLMKIANEQAGDNIKYSFGAVSEDLGGASDTSRKNANDAEREYVEACEAYNGTYASA